MRDDTLQNVAATLLQEIKRAPEPEIPSEKFIGAYTWFAIIRFRISWAIRFLSRRRSKARLEGIAERVAALESREEDPEELLNLRTAVEDKQRRLDFAGTHDEILRSLYYARARGGRDELRFLEGPLVSTITTEPISSVVPVVRGFVQKRIEAGDALVSLTDPSVRNPVDAATNLFNRGRALRETSAPRGSLTITASAREPLKAEKRYTVNRMLSSNDTQLRNQVALVLGEWGGASEAEALAEALRKNQNSSDGAEFARYCIAALKNIGGKAAVSALCDAVESGSEAIQLAVLNAIEELAAGGFEVYGEGTPHFDPPRGRYAKGDPPAPGTERLTKTLEKTMNKAESSQAVRERSRELLYHVLV